MNILFIGDLIGNSGRNLLRDHLNVILSRYDIDICIANGENAAAGLGITKQIARSILTSGVDVITMGNHTWSKRDFINQIEDVPNVIRPANGPASWPGQDHALIKSPQGDVIVINLLGRIFMDAHNDPFQMIEKFIEQLKQRYNTNIVIVDFHAEATSEKVAMGWFLDGKVSLVAGTHTHVQTADERLLEQGTAYITDVGMTGPIDGIIGMDRNSSLRRFSERLPSSYEMAAGRAQLNAVVVNVDENSGKALSIKRICWPHISLNGE